MFEKAIEDLIVMNDFNNLTLSELKERYCSSRESYEAFLKVFNRIFTRRRAYPLIISHRFDDILSIIKSGSEDSEDIYKDIETMIQDEIEHDRHYDGFDSGQMLYCFMNIIGATKDKRNQPSFDDVISKILNVVWILNDSRELSKDDYIEYLNACKNLMDSGQLSKEFAENDTMRLAYCEENPKMSLCHDINFLYAANFLMAYHKDECTDEVLDTIKTVIEITQDKSLIETPVDFDEKSYSKVANYTLAKIDEIKGIKKKPEKISSRLRKIIQKKAD